MRRNLLHPRVRAAASWIAWISAGWVLSDLLRGRLGWDTAIIIAFSAVLTVVAQAGFGWVDRIDRRERERDGAATTAAPSASRDDGDGAAPPSRR